MVSLALLAPAARAIAADDATFVPTMAQVAAIEGKLQGPAAADLARSARY